MDHSRAHAFIRDLLKHPGSLIGRHPLLEIECRVDHGVEYSSTGDYLRRRFELTIGGECRPGLILVPEGEKWIQVSLDSYIGFRDWTRTDKALDLAFDGSSRRATDVFESSEHMVLRHKGRVTSWRSGQGSIAGKRTIELIRESEPELLYTDAADKEFILLGKVRWAVPSSAEIQDLVLRAFRYASIVENPA
jgi:hypothetical protein